MVKWVLCREYSEHTIIEKQGNIDDIDNNYFVEVLQASQCIYSIGFMLHDANAAPWFYVLLEIILQGLMGYMYTYCTRAHQRIVRIIH